MQPSVPVLKEVNNWMASLKEALLKLQRKTNKEKDMDEQPQLLDEQERVLQQAQRIQADVTSRMLQMLENGTNRAIGVLDNAGRQLEITMGVAAMRERNNMVAKVLEELDNEREVLSKRLEQTKSPSLKKYIQNQIKALEAKEESVLAAFTSSAPTTAKQLEEKK